MKNPNGYGSVVKLSGNRRNPFCARRTTGYNDKGQPVYKAIGYYPTRKDAMMALADYNRQPFDIDLSKITLSQLFEKWKTREYPKMKEGSIRCHNASYNYCEAFYNMPYKSIKSYHMQETIDNCGKSYAMQGAIKNFWGQLDKFAYELEIITKLNSTLLKSDPIPPTSKRPFTPEHINMLWDNQDLDNVDTVLILMYSGFRISEFLGMKMSDINFDEMYFKGGVKTASGKNRIVPIHPLIQKFVIARRDKGYKYLMGMHKYSKDEYYTIWYKIMNKFDMKYTPHECRHTFRSLLDSAGANKVCIDLMMGHKSKEVGERIYTHKTLQELKEALALVTR